MSGLVSGVTKIFSSIGTGVAKLGSAVRAVGASLFTAGAATGTGVASAASGGFGGLLGGGGVLGNMLGGAVKQAVSGGLIGGIIGGVTGQGFGAGLKQGALSGAVSGGVGAGVEGLFATPSGVDPMTTGSTEPLVRANTPTGAAPNIRRVGGAGSQPGNFGGLGTAAMAATAGAGAGAGAGGTTAGGGGLLGGLGNFLKTEGGAGLISGLGAGIGEYMKAKSEQEIAEADRQFLLDKERRITEGYDVPTSALVGGTARAADTTVRPTPAQAYGREAWRYNPATGQIESTRVA